MNIHIYIWKEHEDRFATEDNPNQLINKLLAVYYQKHPGLEGSRNIKLNPDGTVSPLIAVRHTSFTTELTPYNPPLEVNPSRQAFDEPRLTPPEDVA